MKVYGTPANKRASLTRIRQSAEPSQPRAAERPQRISEPYALRPRRVPAYTQGASETSSAYPPPQRGASSVQKPVPRTCTARTSPIARARYEVVFCKNNLFVYRYGHPDNPVFSARGKP